LTVFTAAHDVLVDYVVVCGGDVAVGHPLELAEFLELT